MSGNLEETKGLVEENTNPANSGSVSAETSTSAVVPTPPLEYTEEPEQKDKTRDSAGSDTVVTGALDVVPAPPLEYTKEPEQKNKTSDGLSSGSVEAATSAAGEGTKQPSVSVEISYSPPKRKKSRKGVIALAVLIILAGAAASAYSFGILGGIISYGSLRMKNITEPPVGAELPVFSPADPAEYTVTTSDELEVVPDETGLESPDMDEISAETPLILRNHYTQTLNVSRFYTDAAQDESYVYYLKSPSAGGKFSDLMRMKILNGKSEPVPNANEVNERIYSFTLFGRNIITCEYRNESGTYAFFRVPKSGEDAQMLFEYDSPAYMNVHDNKIFMLFASSRKLGIFDPETDTQPALIELGEIEDDVECLPTFSVMNGYLYYGISYNGGKSTRYLRRSLYTGETAIMLDSGVSDNIAILNPCWDEEGGAYYAQFDPDTKAYSLIARKSEGSPEILSSFDLDGEDFPLIALKDEFVIAMAASGTLCKYERDDFTIELDAETQNYPYAVTKDYLITADGIYRISDFSLID